MSQHKAKRVSNYELFFDLAVVLAIGQLTSAIHLDHLGFSEILSFAAAGVIMLNIWNNEAIYYNKYGDSRRIDIYSVIALMLWMGNLALSYNFDVHYLSQHYSNVLVFNLMLILSYATIALQYYLKGRVIGFTRDIKVSMTLLLIYILPLIPIALGILRYSNWAVVLYFLPLILPLFVRRTETLSLVNFPHALERNQLLTILTFGETVIATIKTFPLTTYPLEGIVIFFGMAGLFISYMTQTFLNVDHHHPRSTRPLFYAHAIIILSLLFFTVGLEFLADHHHHDMGVWFFLGSIVTYYLGLGATSYYNQAIYKPSKKLYGLYSLVIALGIGLMYVLNHQLLWGGLILIVMNYTIHHMNMIYRRRKRDEHNVPHPDSRLNLKDFS